VETQELDKSSVWLSEENQMKTSCLFRFHWYSKMVPVLAYLAPIALIAQTALPNVPYSVVDRGPFYRVLQRTVWTTNNSTGLAAQEVQTYTELENGTTLTWRQTALGRPWRTSGRY